jgi:ferredoxin
MSYVISQQCAGTCDTACVDVCPCDCIVGPVHLSLVRAIAAADRPARLAGIQLYIDPAECIDCGACLPECPVDAIAHESDAVAADIDRNAKFFASRGRL